MSSPPISSAEPVPAPKWAWSIGRLEVELDLPTRPQTLEIGAVLAVLIFALWTRLKDLGTVPRVITADETDNLQVAYHILSHTGPGFFGFDWKPAPIFSLYPLAWTIQVFGDSVADFRMFPVILSLLTLVAFYAVARLSLRPQAAIPALLLLASNMLVLNFSRTAWENLNASVFALGACFAVSRALKTAQLRWWALTGCFVACGMYGYFSGRLIFVAVALVALLAVGLRLAPWASTLRGLVVAGVVSAVLFAPMASNISSHWTYFDQRTKAVSVFNTEQPYEGETDGWAIAAKNAVRNFRGFIFQEGKQFGRGTWDRYNPPNRAPLDRWMTVLFLCGVLVGIKRWRQTIYWWPFAAPVFIAEVFSRNTPDAARGVMFVPFYFLFIGLLFDEIFQRISNTRFQAAAVIAVAILASGLGLNEVHSYFHWQGEDVVQNARKPGVEACEFPVWRQLALTAARSGRANYEALTSPQWEETRKQAQCAPVVEKQSPDEDSIAPSATPVAGLTAAERDEQRRTDLASLRGALGSYFAKNAHYPDTKNSIQSLCVYAKLDAGCQLQSFLKPLPRDPGERPYWYQSDGKTFTVYAEMENVASGCAKVTDNFFPKPQQIECLSGPDSP